MTAKRTGGDAPTSTTAKAAARRESKGSVKEAIGKLIGDDTARARGSAEKHAGAADTSDIQKSSRS
ncbi:MAG: hypothetical protein V4537_18030 [Pseudomonadota bacterium]